LDYNGSPSRKDIPEQRPLRTPGSRFSNVVGSYGSIVSESNQYDSKHLPNLELPSPAIGLDRTKQKKNKDLQLGPPVYEPGSPQIQRTPSRPQRYASSPAIIKNGNPPSGESYAGGSDGYSKTANFLRRVFTNSDMNSPGKSYQTNISSEVTKKEDDFYDFLDAELDKIETFYRQKEVEATERLQQLRRQLHMMRDQRTTEMMEAERSGSTQGGGNGNGNYLNVFPKTKWTQAIAGRHHFGKNSRALANMQTPQTPGPMGQELSGDWRDFVRRTESTHVPYRTAKRKLKLAMQEYYRGLELLKAYAYLNRKAFRKINKKFDKAVDMRPTLRYMSEKVNRAYFVQSEVVEGHMVVVEDLYSRYFEKGNRKIAVTKLRGKHRSDDHSPSTFRIGLFLAAGLVCCIQGLILAIGLLNDANSTVQVQTSYLLQVCLRYFLPTFQRLTQNRYMGDIF
jgi:xenotropic and polytropic retrovirus receptor 1